MAVKITSFLTGMILVVFIIAVFGLFAAELNTYYGGDDYDNETFEAYDKLDEITDNTEEIRNRTLTIKQNPSALDVIGGYISDAYNALIITKASFDTFESMSNDAIEQAPLGETGRLLRGIIPVIVMLLIAIGIFLAAILKWEL